MSFESNIILSLSRENYINIVHRRDDIWNSLFVEKISKNTTKSYKQQVGISKICSYIFVRKTSII